MRGVLLALALAACVTPAGEARSRSGAGNEPPDWLSGYWLSCERRETAESWIGSGAGVLLGVNLTLGGRDSFEFLRIAPGAHGGLSYIAMPNGRAPPTEFPMVSNDGSRAVFENLGHDFPQRIIYSRQGDILIARIEDAGASRVMQWRFRRAAPDSRCSH